MSFLNLGELSDFEKRNNNNLDKRINLLLKCENNYYNQQLALEACKADIITWVNNFVVTFDPRLVIKFVPFILFPKQEEYLLWCLDKVNNKQNGLLEKSRDIGATWLSIIMHVWFWLFTPGYSGTFGTRGAVLLDKRGNADSIFEKIRILLRNLPSWMLPVGFDWNKHDNIMRLINPENGATITGEIGDNMGRGGRSSIYSWDEVAFSEHPTSIDAALSGNTNVIFYTSTVNGYNFFYKKKTFLEELNKNLIFRIHWTDDTRKDQLWYDEQCQKYDPVTIASELDINYGASVEGIFIQNLWVLAAINFEIPNDTNERVASLDVAVGGKCSNVFMIREGQKVVHIQSWQGLDPTQTAFKARDLCIEHKAKYLNFDSDCVGEGVAGTLASEFGLPFVWNALHGAARASETYYWIGEDKTSYEKFFNARAEWWGHLRRRFKNTYDYVNGIRTDFTADDLISIPNNPTLIQEVCQPKAEYVTNGKILLESKQQMIKRGLKSPDTGDSLAYCFAPIYTGFWEQ